MTATQYSFRPDNSLSPNFEVFSAESSGPAKFSKKKDIAKDEEYHSGLMVDPFNSHWNK